MTRLTSLALLSAGLLIASPNLARAQQREAPARIRIRVPAANASVWFDGQPTFQSGLDRLFVSPPLLAGQKCSYTVRATWLDNGRLVDIKKKVPVGAGGESVVEFSRPLEQDMDRPLTPPIAPEMELGNAPGRA